jgi:hypothetical protein
VEQRCCFYEHHVAAADSFIAGDFTGHPEYIQRVVHTVVPELVRQLGTEFFYDELLGSAIVHATGNPGVSIANA